VTEPLGDTSRRYVFEDVASATRKSMQSNRRRDTTPELAIRRLLHRAGERYRVDFRAAAQGRRVHVDIAFPRRKLAVFVDGCYWHGCPIHATTPVTNRDYWVSKIAENRLRDEQQTAALRACEWSVLRIWEHEPAAEAVERILDALTAIDQFRPRTST